MFKHSVPPQTQLGQRIEVSFPTLIEVLDCRDYLVQLLGKSNIIEGKEPR